MRITILLVSQLIKEQFPQWAHLPIKPVKSPGHDHRTFHLGQEIAIKLPSAQAYSEQVKKEQNWLPILAKHLTLPISEQIALGNPSKKFPWHWGIYRWLEGESATTSTIDRVYLKYIAQQLAQFLNELHKIDSTGAPLPGTHNFYRGGSLAVYDAETRSAINELKSLIDPDTCLSIWETALQSEWENEPVWIHGDFSAGNFLVHDNKVNAIIDFGLIAVGDPACDLTIAWTFFKNESRDIFKAGVNLDHDTWARARGWGLWKALITILLHKDPHHQEVKKRLAIIEAICGECNAG